tara:strand:+ start:31 stop:321 length:291 start_codon:yes stop_codon:yes gene_type:complete
LTLNPEPCNLNTIQLNKTYKNKPTKTMIPDLKNTEKETVAYEIKFSPVDPLSYTYVIYANDKSEAIHRAIEEIQFDIGYDRSKDFEITNIICSDDE